MYEVTIPGPEGRIEGRYNKGSINNPPLVILLHPHPAHGGNMNNKIIYNCFKNFTSRSNVSGNSFPSDKYIRN